MTITSQFEATDGGLMLTSAILLYQSEDQRPRHPYNPPRSNAPTFASIHAVEHDSGRPTIAAGAPLSRAQLRQWTEALGRAEAPEILPDNVLVSHADMVAWWVPAKIRASYFALTRPPEGARVLAARTVVQLPYPAHVFVATRSGLGVYALRENVRPIAETVLLHSPVLNVFIDGRLCWGNIPKPKALTTASMAEYERAVFDSWSTHPNVGQENTVSGKGGLVALWEALAARKATHFPARRLKPFGSTALGTAAPMTLGALIKRSARA